MCMPLLPSQVERIGTTFNAMASREQMSYTMDCLKTSLPASLELLCDAVVNPAFLPQEVEEQKVPCRLCVYVCVCVCVSASARGLLQVCRGGTCLQRWRGVQALQGDSRRDGSLRGGDMVYVQGVSVPRCCLCRVVYKRY